MSNTPPPSALFVSLTDAERAALGANYVGRSLEALKKKRRSASTGLRLIESRTLIRAYASGSSAAMRSVSAGGSRKVRMVSCPKDNLNKP